MTCERAKNSAQLARHNQTSHQWNGGILLWNKWYLCWKSSSPSSSLLLLVVYVWKSPLVVQSYGSENAILWTRLKCLLMLLGECCLVLVCERASATTKTIVFEERTNERRRKEVERRQNWIIWGSHAASSELELRERILYDLSHVNKRFYCSKLSNYIKNQHSYSNIKKNLTIMIPTRAYQAQHDHQPSVKQFHPLPTLWPVLALSFLHSFSLFQCYGPVTLHKHRRIRHSSIS